MTHQMPLSGIVVASKGLLRPDRGILQPNRVWPYCIQDTIYTIYRRHFAPCYPIMGHSWPNRGLCGLVCGPCNLTGTEFWGSTLRSYGLTGVLCGPSERPCDLIVQDWYMALVGPSCLIIWGPWILLGSSVT